LIARLAVVFWRDTSQAAWHRDSKSLLTILCSLLARPLIPSRAVRLAPAAGKIAGSTQLPIRIHPRMNTLGMLAVAAQHRVGLLGRFFAAAHCQSDQSSGGILNARAALQRKALPPQRLAGRRRALDGDIHVGPPRATDKAARRMGVARVRLRTTITGSLYHSVLFHGTPSSAGKNIVPYEPLERSCPEYS
jgi:hypothetical protein